MQPDEIIQNKEWNELTAEDKAALRGLADTREEYHLLRQILKVSASEPGSVPQMDKHIKEHLMQAMQPVGIIRPLYKYAAAAAILIVTAALFLYPPLAGGEIEDYTPARCEE